MVLGGKELSTRRQKGKCTLHYPEKMTRTRKESNNSAKKEGEEKEGSLGVQGWLGYGEKKKKKNQKPGLNCRHIVG